MHQLDRIFPKMGKDWTRDATLLGGEMPNADNESFFEGLRTQYPWMTRPLHLHYARHYGARSKDIGKSVDTIAALDEKFGATLYEAEARHLVNKKWAQSLEDILRRRTKHALHINASDIATFTAWFEKESFAVAA